MAKNSRLNHDFQILHFLVGQCHTPDGAYSVLCDLQQDRATALKMVKSSSLKTQAKILRANHAIETATTPWEKLEAEAELAEIEAMKEMCDSTVVAAQDELAFIEKCIAEVNEYRRFKHLPDREAHEAAQNDEWKLKIIHDCKLNVLAHGNLSAELLGLACSHPDYKTEIMPALEQFKGRLMSGDAVALTHEMSRHKFELPSIAHEQENAYKLIHDADVEDAVVDSQPV